MSYKAINTCFLCKVRCRLLEVFVILLYQSLLSLSSANMTKDGIVMCEVTAVEPLSNTTLTCSFPENVSDTHRITSVIFSKKERGEVDILDCWWMSGNMSCEVVSGYTFNMNISHKLSVEIPRTSAEYIGMYYCTLSNMDYKAIRPCELKIKLEGKTMCDIPSVPQKSKTSLTCYFPKDLNKTRTDFSVDRYSNQGVTENVMYCHWKGEGLNCNTVRGYQFDHRVSDHLTLKVPSASEDHEGTYRCSINGNKSITYQNCSFALKKEMISSNNSASFNEKDSIELACRFKGENIQNRIRWDFSAVRLDNEGGNSTDVLSCTWKNDSVVWIPAPDYDFKHFLVTVPRDTEEHNGDYLCYLNPSSNISTLSRCKHSSNTDETTGLAVSITLFLVAVVIALVILTVFRVLKHKCRQRDNKRERDERGNKEDGSETVEELLPSITGQHDGGQSDEQAEDEAYEQQLDTAV
ncbi:uncharacterized protein LOC112576196 isoform X2 [Pomacea canaliculata]|uniref:uncharacterized protein LOC112576196 isoform X2 n=1 Tax=Pomacea canaliculata TaxID=400727 RepID=UPI000D728AC0|nr:uncharacterized protein LOC112576196 isoform X2 [Pomacea canaliculata]